MAKAKSQTQEVYQPMAVKPPSTEEEIEALKIRQAALEKRIANHERHHFGKTME